MPCEHYKDALIEVTASGSTPQGELRAHLAGCASCRAAFDAEQSLFTAIDSGLHAATNGEIPPSLIPRVRARLDESAIAGPRWRSSWFALAGVAAAVAAFLFVVTTRQNNSRATPTNLAANRAPALHVLPSVQGASPSIQPKKGSFFRSTPDSNARNSMQRGELASYKPTPEVLVPRDQEILLAAYAEQWDSRKHPPLAAGAVDQKAAALLEISPIQITELGVKPLTEEGSE